MYSFDVDPYLIHGSLDHMTEPPNGISIGSAVFAQLTRVSNTQTQITQRATCVTIGRISCTARNAIRIYNVKRFTYTE